MLSRIVTRGRLPLPLASNVRRIVPISRLVQPTTSIISTRFYSGAPPLTKELITERILEILEDYDNVKNVDKISTTANYSKDLGLDSLDQVEVIMEVENEFCIVIPDQDADNLKTVDQTVEYILKQPDAC